MALDAGIVWEVRTTGSDTNGGGFKAGATGTDWSQQNSAQYAVTDAVTNGTTTITSATASFGTDVVGNLLYIAGGTGSITGGWYEITVRTDATTITVDRSTGLTTGTGATLNIGGALASPSIAAGTAVKGNDVWIKSGTYVITTSTTNTSGGRVYSVRPIYIEGYETTRGDRGAKPVIDAGAITGIVIVYVYSGDPETNHVCNLKVDGKGNATVTGFESGDRRSGLSDCEAVNCVIGFKGQGTPYRCLADNCSTDGFQNSYRIFMCVAKSCGAGFRNTGVLVDCLAYDCTWGFITTSTIPYFRCVADNCSTYGFNQNYNEEIACMATNCTTGFVGHGGSTNKDCFVYNNTTDVSPANLHDINLTVLTADPYTNQAGKDFSLNNVTGGGAELRGRWGLPGQLQTSDASPVQHADPAGGGGLLRVGMNGGISG